MSNPPTPRRIEWRGPENWTVWSDEDGTHLKSARGDCLEMPDVERLIALWTQAREMTVGNAIPAPRPLTREEARQMFPHQADARAARRAIKAVKEALDNDTDDQPF